VPTADKDNVTVTPLATALPPLADAVQVPVTLADAGADAPAIAAIAVSTVAARRTRSESPALQPVVPKAVAMSLVPARRLLADFSPVIETGKATPAAKPHWFRVGLNTEFRKSRLQICRSQPAQTQTGAYSQRRRKVLQPGARIT